MNKTNIFITKNIILPTMLVLLCLVISAGTVKAATANGGTVVLSQASNVSVTLMPSSSGANNQFGLYSPQYNALGYGHVVATGTKFDLGQLPAGELIFFINHGAGQTWFTGPASRNSDNTIHANVSSIVANQWIVSFEDMQNGGDKDYNDVILSVTATAATPAPAPAPAPISPTCTQNYQQKCSGNSIYWYNSCGVQGDFVQTCTNGCSGNVCNPTTTCTKNYQQRCVGNSIYWYDSCNSQGDFIQTCQNGCSGNVCNPVQNCIPYSHQQCSGNSIYWYDSCGYQGAFVQTCANGCSGNVCNPTQTCSQNSYQQCVGNSIYWYDSCGSQGAFVQTCANGCSGNVCQNNSVGTLTVAKTVRNLTTGTSFVNSTYASPSDMLMFMITLQASGNQSVQNVVVRDTIPAGLIYNNQLTVACAGNNGNCNNYSGDIISGLNLNTISAGQTVTITYQAQLASAPNFSFGTTTLNNSTTVSGSQIGYTPTSSASVVVTKAGVLGASTVSTGLTNNFWVDSFFLPLLITLIFIWMWRAGMFIAIEKWLNGKNKTLRGYKAEKELSARIAKIKKTE